MRPQLGDTGSGSPGRAARMLMAVGWPAFLAACVLELLVFSLVDPGELMLPGGPNAWTRQAVYTAAFFGFWTICLAACALTAVLAGGKEGLSSRA